MPAVALLRVRSSRAPYRRGGVEFGNLPLVLGPEHFGNGVEGLRQLVAIVTDPVLTVRIADIDTPEQFEPLPEEAIAALIDAHRAVEVAEDKSTLNEAAAYIVASLIGEWEPGIDVAAEAEALRPADEAEARRLADEAEATRLAGEAEAQRLADEAEATRIAANPELAGVGLLTGGGDMSIGRVEPVSNAGAAPAPGVEVLPGVTAPVSMGAPAATEPKKGDAVPAKAKAKADAKPQGSSGRQSKPANSPAA